MDDSLITITIRVPRPNRRWLRFSLGTLLLIITGLAVWFAIQFRQDPAAAILEKFAAAIAQQDVGLLKNLYLPPDDTPAGQLRQQDLLEAEKDWNADNDIAPNAVTFTGTETSAKGTEKVIRTNMTIEGENGSFTMPVRFRVVKERGHWRIVERRYHPPQQD